MATRKRNSRAQESARDDADDIDEFAKHRSRFFEPVGYCVSHYQTIEDYLADMFAIALGGNPSRAAALFNVARGLEAKIQMISAALLNADKERQDQWQLLRRRVWAAAEARNQIAHARPTQFAKIRVYLDKKLNATRVKKNESSRMELRKYTKAGHVVWSNEMLHAEAKRNDRLFRHLIVLAKQLKGETPPAHLPE
jgi:hypothetical protein